LTVSTIIENVAESDEDAVEVPNDDEVENEEESDRLCLVVHLPDRLRPRQHNQIDRLCEIVEALRASALGIDERRRKDHALRAAQVLITKPQSGSSSR
jgi:predicted amidophosphoribosyltransferase